MKSKVELIMFVTYAELSLSILHIIAEQYELSLASIFGFCFVIMFVYLLMWICIFGIGHLATSIFYCVNGLGPSPILLYPFVFGANKNKQCQLFWNFFCIGEIFYPKKLYIDAKNYNKEKISKICWNAQLISFFAEVFACLIYGGILVCLGYGWIGVSSILIIVTLYLIANLKTDAYHGCFVKARYIKQGYAGLYLARHVILYSNENHVFYDEFEKIILNDYQEDFQFICFETLKHMYMIKCINDQFQYPDKTKDLVVEKGFLKSMDEYNRMDIADEQFSLMKAYLCYSVIRDDVSAKNILRYYLEALVNEENRGVSLVKFDSTFGWYLRTLNNGRAQEQNTAYYKNTVLRRNQFLEAFPNYKKIYIQITKEMQ